MEKNEVYNFDWFGHYWNSVFDEMAQELDKQLIEWLDSQTKDN